MNKKALSKTNIIKKWPFLKISILVLGNLVIFGLGFALGLHYAQDLYLVDEEFVPNKTYYNEYCSSVSKAADEFSFYYGLMKSTHKDSKRDNGGIVSKKKKEKIGIKKDNKNNELQSQLDMLAHSQSGYTIQLYSFKSRHLSEKKILELKERGFPAYQSEIDHGNDEFLYRVRVGRFKNREEAKRVLQKILEFETKEAYITRD